MILVFAAWREIEKIYLYLLRLMSSKKIMILIIMLGGLFLTIFHRFLAEQIPVMRYRWFPFDSRLRGARTNADVLARYGDIVRQRLRPAFEQAGLAATPGEIALLAFKTEQRVELWGRGETGWTWLKNYPFTATSGQLGPKLREGDRQIPEGVYRLMAFNPNSSYHLSLKIGYPNAFDQAMAAAEGRTQLGGDIFLHGKAASVGCIPVGDAAIEELFVLALTIGLKRMQIIIAPHDFRRDPRPPVFAQLAWTAELYAQLADALRPFDISRND